MYVTAHRVRTPREEGINAYYYSHGSHVWTVPPDPDVDPGTLVNTLLLVESVGGNQVRSYLDVTAADGVLWPAIEPVFVQFIKAKRLTPFPWDDVVGLCRFRVAMERSLASEWRREIGLLYKACVLVHPAPAG